MAVVGGGGYYVYHQSQGSEAKNEKVGNFDVSYDNKGKVLKGGHLKVAYDSDQPIKMQWDSLLSTDSPMSSLAGPAGGQASLFYADEEFHFIDDGPAKVSFNKKDKSALVTLRDNLKWSDGHPVTAKDYEFEYEIIANPDYGSQRWTDEMGNIVGLKEFHDGKADKISGITYPDGENGKKIKLQFKEYKPNLNIFGNGYILQSAAPYHYLKDVPAKKLISSPKTTTKPLVLGPFKPAKVVSGESVYFVPNKYYWGKKPKLDSITYTTVAPSKVAAAMKSGKYDLIVDAQPAEYKQLKKLDNIHITGQEELYLSLLYFNLGEYDTDKGINLQNRKTPLQDVNVRKAVGYARNVEDVNKKFNNGLKTRANSVIPAANKAYHDSSLKGYPQDLDKANKLLDKAGYKWDDKKEYREKDGKRLTLTYLARSGQANSEAEAQNYIQQWKKIGIDVKLYKDRLIDFNSWVELASAPKGTWDISDAAWSLTPDPSQSDLFSKTSSLNMGHFTSPELTKKLQAVNSPKNDTEAKRKKALDAYQKYMNDQAYVIPTSYNISYAPVNNRVAGWTQSNDVNEIWTRLGVTAKQPVK